MGPIYGSPCLDDDSFTMVPLLRHCSCNACCFDAKTFWENSNAVFKIGSEIISTALLHKNILNYQYGMPFSTYMQRNALFLVGYDMLFLCFDFSVFSG